MKEVKNMHQFYNRFSSRNSCQTRKYALGFRNRNRGDFIQSDFGNDLRLNRTKASRPQTFKRSTNRDEKCARNGVDADLSMKCLTLETKNGFDF